MATRRSRRNPADPPDSTGLRSARDPDREAAERLDEVRQHYADLYARRDVVTQTVTPSGQRLDWVPVESQAGPPSAPPDPGSSPPPQDPDRRARPSPFELADPGAETGPPGTVPLARTPLDDLDPALTLQDHLAKDGRARPPTPPDVGAYVHSLPDDPVHKYGHASQPVANFGTEGVINTWRPYVQWWEEFSLGQLWVVAGTGDGLQTLEVGVQTYPYLYGDFGPHLFLFYTTNHYTVGGDNLGGYNTDVAGWTQVSRVAYPKMPVAESVAGGDQYELALKVQLWQGDWWVRVGEEWMGYYPAALYNAAGLRDRAASVDWGGEITDYTADHPEPTSTVMGSGHFPVDGWQHAAYMRNLSYQSDTGGTMIPVNGYPWASNPDAYQITADWSGATTWGSSFYWGGPGGVA